MHKFVRQFRLLVFVFCFCLSPCVLRAAPEVPEQNFVNVCSAIVFDLDNEAVIFEQNPDQPIPPASLTKVLSLFLALDYIQEGLAGFNNLVTISPEAAAEDGSSMGLKALERVRLADLLLGMAVSSGNDASYAVAEYIGGSIPAFVAMMNAKASALGMTDSHFCNPNGLPAQTQYTTARDMLTLARAYLRAHPWALSLHNTRTLNHAGQVTWNRNPLLKQYAGADGLKTGWVRASGYNFIFTAKRGNKRLLAVIMGAPDAKARGVEACRLLDAGFKVCNNEAVSVAMALNDLPVENYKLDLRRNSREAKLLYADAFVVKKVQTVTKKSVTKVKKVVANKRLAINKVKKNTKKNLKSVAKNTRSNRSERHARRRS